VVEDPLIRSLERRPPPVLPQAFARTQIGQETSAQITETCNVPSPAPSFATVTVQPKLPSSAIEYTDDSVRIFAPPVEPVVKQLPLSACFAAGHSASAETSAPPVGTATPGTLTR